MMRIGFLILLGFAPFAEAKEKPFHRFFPAKIFFYQAGPRVQDPMMIGHGVCIRRGWDGVASLDISDALIDPLKGRIDGIRCAMRDEMNASQLLSLQVYKRRETQGIAKEPFVSDPRFDQDEKRKAEEAAKAQPATD